MNDWDHLAQIRRDREADASKERARAGVLSMEAAAADLAEAAKNLSKAANLFAEEPWRQHPDAEIKAMLKTINAFNIAKEWDACGL